MDFSPMALLAPSLFWLLPLAFAIGLLKSPWVKGYLGELLVRLFAHWRLDSQTYRRLHNVTLPTPDGPHQINHVFLSRYGIFGVETKNLSGWIFGSEHQAQWTQKLYRRTFRFQNPLQQNYKHLKALEATLGVNPEHLHSVISFVGGSTFKTEVPANVTQGASALFAISGHSSCRCSATPRSRKLYTHYRSAVIHKCARRSPSECAKP